MGTQERIAFGMGRNGRALPDWVANHEHLLAAYQAGRVEGGHEAHPLVPADRTQRHEHEQHADERHERHEHEDQAEHDDARPPASEPVVVAVEEPVEVVEEELPALRMTRRQARELGRRGEPLPAGFAHHAQLRRAHAAGRADAAWRHPLGLVG